MSKQPVILFRKVLSEENELDIARKYFRIIESRGELVKMQDSHKTLVIPRYSALPYYKELENDVSFMCAELINSFREHQYVADLEQWYADFEDVTPKTWFQVSRVPTDQPGAFVLKGATNSRKQNWRTHMYADNRADISRVLGNLLDDQLLSQQGIYVRQHEPFVSYGEGINGLPITREFRFFILDGEILASGWYWSEHVDHVAFQATPPDLTLWVEENICPRLRDRIRFVVADVAQHSDGRYRLVELNCGTMSGLSCVNMDELYGKLYARLAP